MIGIAYKAPEIAAEGSVATAFYTTPRGWRDIVRERPHKSIEFENQVCINVCVCVCVRGVFLCSFASGQVFGRITGVVLIGIRHHRKGKATKPCASDVLLPLRRKWCRVSGWFASFAFYRTVRLDGVCGRISAVKEPSGGCGWSWCSWLLDICISNVLARVLLAASEWDQTMLYGALVYALVSLLERQTDGLLCRSTVNNCKNPFIIASIARIPSVYRSAESTRRNLEFLSILNYNDFPRLNLGTHGRGSGSGFTGAGVRQGQ